MNQVPPDANRLNGIAHEVRGNILEMSNRAGTPHIAGALSCVEGLVAAYFGGVFHLEADEIVKGTSDTVIFSKGHAVSAVYAVLAVAGVIAVEDLLTYNVNGGRLPEQPAVHCVPGIAWATGSLGHGLPVGVGLALARKRQNDNRRVVVVMSDGECQEGSVWEAAMLASHHGLDNLTVMVDANGWQATDRVANVTGLYPMEAKWAAFGWQETGVDGRTVTAVVEALRASQRTVERPSAIVMHTIKGQGVSFMEVNNYWHYRSPTAEEVTQALLEMDVS